MSEIEHDVKLKLYPRFFELYKHGLKTLELRKEKKAEVGDIVKLTRVDNFGEEPLYREVYDVYSEYADNLTVYELRHAWITVDFLYSYLGGDLGRKVFLHDLKEVDVDD
jgi:hypothetical protein